MLSADRTFLFKDAINVDDTPNPFHYVIAPRTDAERLEVEAWLLADQLLNVLNDGQPRAFQRRDQIRWQIEGFMNALQALQTPESSRIYIAMQELTIRMRQQSVAEFNQAAKLYTRKQLIPE